MGDVYFKRRQKKKTCSCCVRDGRFVDKTRLLHNIPPDLGQMDNALRRPSSSSRAVVRGCAGSAYVAQIQPWKTGCSIVKVMRLDLAATSLQIIVDHATSGIDRPLIDPDRDVEVECLSRGLNSLTAANSFFCDTYQKFCSVGKHINIIMKPTNWVGKHINIFMKPTNWVGKHINIIMKPTNSPTQEKIRSSGNWATFSPHNEPFFVGLGINFMWETDYKKPNPTKFILREHRNTVTLCSEIQGHFGVNIDVKKCPYISDQSGIYLYIL